MKIRYINFLLPLKWSKCSPFPANIYLFKINNRNTTKRCKIYLKLIIKTTNNVNDVVLVSLLLTLNIFQTFFYCCYCWLWTGKCLLGYFKVYFYATRSITDTMQPFGNLLINFLTLSTNTALTPKQKDYSHWPT